MGFSFVCLFVCLLLLKNKKKRSRFLFSSLTDPSLILDMSCLEGHQLSCNREESWPEGHLEPQASESVLLTKSPVECAAQAGLGRTAGQRLV